MLRLLRVIISRGSAMVYSLIDTVVLGFTFRAFHESGESTKSSCVNLEVFPTLLSSRARGVLWRLSCFSPRCELELTAACFASELFGSPKQTIGLLDAELQ